MAKAREVMPVVVVCIVGGLYVYAGALKFWRPDQLLTDILSYQLVPYKLAVVSSYLLPAIELVVGLGIFARKLRFESAAILSVLTFIFTVALVTAWARGLDISCGCFGKSTVKANYPLLVSRDLAIVAGCLYVCMHSRGAKVAAPKVVPA